MNKSVLTISGGCDCGGGAGNIGLGGGENSSAGSDIVVRSRPGIINGNVIKKYNELGKTIYELDDLVEQKPMVLFSNDAPVIEVGYTLPLVVFSGSITQGTYPIASRSITPDPGGLDLSAPFTFQKEDVKRSSPGVLEQHTLQATDEQGNIVSVVSKVDVKYAFFQGFKEFASLTQQQIKALANKSLIDNILQLYGGEKSYVIPALPAIPNYIYWAGPVGTPMISAASLNGLTLPLVTLSTVDVNNDNDNTIIQSYWVIRTANKLIPGTYSIILQ